MKKIITLVILLALVWAIPPVRGKVGGAAAPMLDRLGPVGEKLATPARRYSAQNEVKFLLRLFTSDATEGKQLPQEREFREWLKRRAPQESGVDPWGNPYWLKRESTRVTVGSNGPDGERGTADDLTQTASY